MNLEMFVVGADGQVTVDWDSLELITSDRFVESVRYWCEEAHSDVACYVIKKIDRTYLGNGRYTVKIFASNDFGFIRIWSFVSDRPIHYKLTCLNTYDLETIISIRDGKDVF